MESDQFEIKDPKQFFEELVKKALIGEHSKFEFIRSYEMLRVARLYRKSVRKVIKIFKDLHKGLLKSYATAVGEDKQKLEELMSAIQFNHCKDFYVAELNIVKNMIQEYRVYVESGHILFTLMGGVRPESDCVDFRKLPIKWF